MSNVSAKETSIWENLPDGWQVKSLKHVSVVQLSNVDKLTIEGQEPVLLCNYVDVYKNEKITSSIPFMQATATDEQIKRLSIQQNDVLFTKDSETPEDIGVPALVSEDLKGVVCGYHLAMARPHPNQLLGGYLFRVLQSEPVKKYFFTCAVGMTRWGLDKQALSEVSIPIPPLPEQHAIADYLDRETKRLDSLIAAKERLLELLAEKRRAVITHAVTRGLNPNVSLRDSGVNWLEKIPSHWEVLRLKFLIFGIETGFTPQSNNFPAADGEWGVLKTGCVNGGVFNPQENKALTNEVDIPLELEVTVGNVLMSRASGSTDLIGSVALVDQKPYTRLLLSDKTFRIKVNQQVCDSRFFVSIMGSFFMRHQIKQIVSGAEGLANNIAQTDIREFWLPVPPLDEQREIIKNINEWITRIDRLYSIAEKTLNLLHERRASLIAAAVSGQIRVV